MSLSFSPSPGWIVVEPGACLCHTEPQKILEKQEDTLLFSHFAKSLQGWEGGGRNPQILHCFESSRTSCFPPRLILNWCRFLLPSSEYGEKLGESLNSTQGVIFNSYLEQTHWNQGVCFNLVGYYPKSWRFHHPSPSSRRWRFSPERKKKHLLVPSR